MSIMIFAAEVNDISMITMVLVVHVQTIVALCFRQSPTSGMEFQWVSFAKTLQLSNSSNTMDADFCIEALEEALARYGRPEIFNTDQGSQFTSADFTGVLLREGIAISMDGKGRFMDNIFIERLWRSLKYEEVFIKSYATAFEARSGIGSYIALYNSERIHQKLGYRTPDEVFNAGTSLWICGQSASPTGSASPMFPPTIAEAAMPVHGNMGKCSPLPTYPQAQPQQEDFDLTIGKEMVSFPSAPPASRLIGAQAPGGTLS